MRLGSAHRCEEKNKEIQPELLIFRNIVCCATSSVAIMQVVSELLRRGLAARQARGIPTFEEVTGSACKADNICSLSNLSVFLPPCLS